MTHINVITADALHRVQSDGEAGPRGFRLVCLNGLLHSDDGAAIRELARQLSCGTPIAQDTTISLQPCPVFVDGSAPRATTAEAADAVIEALRSGSAIHSQCIVVVLDEFDLFAHATKQTLLYTLFDISQSGHAPLVVVGMTCRLDALALLEKRVLSRFSSRQIHLFPQQAFEDFQLLFRETLRLPGDFSHASYARAWHASVDTLCQSDAVTRELQKLYDVNRDLRALHTMIALPVCRLNINKPYLVPADFFESQLRQTQDSKVALLLGGSLLELCVLIATHHVSEIVFPDSFNFEMVFDNYKAFCLDPNNKGADFYSKPITYKAFEHLMALEIIMPVAQSSSHRTETSSFHPVRLMISTAQLTEIVDKYPGLPSHVRMWAKLQ